MHSDQMPIPDADHALLPKESRRIPKPVRVLIGITLMIALVAGGLAYLGSRAGEWGVPYFSFTTAHGTDCTNTWTGYTCADVTQADFEEWADLKIPEGTTLVTAKYTKNNADFEVVSELRTDAKHAKPFGEALAKKYGQCQGAGYQPAELKDHKDVCLVNSVLARGTQEAPLTRRWMLATGVDADGSRLTLLTFASR